MYGGYGDEDVGGGDQGNYECYKPFPEPACCPCKVEI